MKVKICEIAGENALQTNC